MIDIITYIPDLDLFRKEVSDVLATKETDNPHTAADLVTLSDDGVALFSPTKTPVHYSDNKSIALVRTGSVSAIEALSTIEIIGEHKDGDYVFYEEGQDKYESVYDASTRTVFDEVLGEIEYTPPYKIGVFI